MSRSWSAMEFEVRVVRGIENCFVSLPLQVIQTLQSGYLPPILAVELRSGARLWHVAWCGSASSSPSSIEIAPQYADCIGLDDHTSVIIRVVSNLPKASLVAVEPATVDDWEILELNSEIAENVILAQVGIAHEGMRFPLWLHGQTVVTFLVKSTVPQNPVVQLVPDTQVAVAPKRRNNPSSEQGRTIPKAQLRVQDLDSRFIYKCQENGVDIDVVFTSGVFIHPETAENFSFSTHQFVTISPRLLPKKSMRKMQTKNTVTDQEASKDGLNIKQDDRHVVPILLSEFVAKGHIMLSQSLRFYLGARLHSWVHVQSCNVTVKKDVPAVSISPYHFKIYQNDEMVENGPEEVKNQENFKGQDALQRINTTSEMGISNWSLHDKLAAALSSRSSPDGVENITETGVNQTKVGHPNGLQSLLHVWFQAQCHIDISNSAENLSSLVVGSKTLLHLKVKIDQLPRYGKVLASSNKLPPNKKLAEKPSVDVIYILSFSEESMHVEDIVVYDLAFEKSTIDNCISEELNERLGKLQLGDLLFSHAASESIHDNFLSAGVSSLDWMGTAQSDVNYRLTALLAPSSGILFSNYNLPLPGHILICGPSGSGKTLLAKVSAKSIEGCKDILAHIVFISCSRLTLEKPSSIRQTLSVRISEALDHAPSIVILDDLDSLIAPSSDLEGSQLSSSSTALVEFLADILDEYGENRRNLCGIGPIAFIATSQSLNSFPTTLSSSGRFDFHVNLPAPAAAERSAILRQEIQKRSLQCSDDLLLDIASKCDGYDAYDLEILTDRSVHAAIGRSLSLSSKSDSGENEDLTLVREDFLQAMQNFLPVAMRDITKPVTEDGRSGWEDVGGLTDIQNSIKEMIELPSKFPNIFAQAPLRLRSNILLYGPPGCGKTHIVGAAAAACSLRFISVKGPELLNKYIGASEQAVRDIFLKATAAAPCLLFFDEFDSIAPKRGHDNTGVTDRVVNQFLTELDGVEVLTGVFVFAATSRPDLLDAALLRPGRLDKLLFCDFPSQQERLEILNVLSRKLPMASDVDMEGIACSTEGFSGADLQALLSDAQLEAVHQLLDGKDSSSTGQKPLISNAVLETIASNAKPSVSEAEKRRLYDIYNQFLDSKRSLSAKSRDVKGKRATLA
ncbi:peroxisome biogenesis protein 1 isoform X1 [Andrographis paniculata]|uniref:peroxisome biogenesis protein 1 isoform X1 n=1 Tax=Andrographis paniculata TaxID=175694 RepID=UPI0021E8D496|nr:peroxisome biogenesis protein 1 isoform X1 [Andrographis paniculata]